MPMSKLYERLGLAAALNPISLTTAVTVASSGPVDMANVDRALVTLAIGLQTATLSIALQAATSTVASDFAALSSAIQATGITASSIQQQLEVLGGSMGGKRYLRALVTASTISSTNTSLVSVIVQTEHGVQPAANASTVQTVVSG